MKILDGFLESLHHPRIDLLEWEDGLDGYLEKFLDGMLERVDFEGGERLGRFLE